MVLVCIIYERSSNQGKEVTVGQYLEVVFFFRIRYGLKGVARWLDLVGLLASLRACSHHGGRSLHQGGAGTYPSRQRRFLPVPPTLLRWHVSVSPTLRSPYPTGQVKRKESSRFAVSRNERHCAASATHSDEMIGEAPPPYSTPPH